MNDPRITDLGNGRYLVDLSNSPDVALLHLADAVDELRQSIPLRSFDLVSLPVPFILPRWDWEETAPAGIPSFIGRTNPKCSIARAGGSACNVDGGDPSRRCGPCRGFALPRNHAERQKARAAR